MKLPRLSSILFAVLLLLVLSVERVFSLPAATMMLFLMQQSIFTEEESCVLAGILGLFIAVMYHVPLAVGMGLFFGVSFISRATLGKPHLQTRDGVLTILFCAVLALITRATIDLISVVGFVTYIGLIIVINRIWISRRWFQPRRLG